MPRGRWARPAMMPRGRVPPRPRRPPTDRERRLAEEVLHLHSLWRRGPPDPVPNPEPEPTPAQSHSADRKTKTSDRKRRKLDAAAAEPKDTGSEWAIAPVPPNSSPKSWPDAAPSSSTPAKPPPPPASPGALAQQKALRAAAEFFSNRGDSSSSDSSDDDEEGSEEQEGEQDAAGFLTGLFERDAALRGHYERGWESGQFACMVCAAGTRKARRFGGCKALVQHAHDATPRYGRRRAHRALAAVLCRVLGWDVARLPSIVMDPRGTLGQALAAGAVAAAAVQLPKENGDYGEDYGSSSDEDEEEDVETGMEDSSTHDDEEENELESSEESGEMEDVETGMEDSSTDGDEEENEPESSEESAEKDVENGTEDSESPDDDGEAIELDNGEKSALKEEMEETGPPNCKEVSKNEVLCNGLVQEVNASKDDSLNQGNNGEVRNQDIAKESSEKDNTSIKNLPGSKDTCKNEGHY